MDTTIKEKIYLAALLHDIGKFYQRADDNGTARSKELDQTVKNLESYICPKSKDGFYTHKHVLWTAQFLIDQGLDKLGDDKVSILRLASFHHNPTDFYEGIVQYADHLSSGMDRTNPESLKDDYASKDWTHFKSTRMKSVFEALFKQENEKFEYELPVHPLTFGKEYFPRKEFTEPPDYASAWQSFNFDLKTFKPGNLVSWSNTMLSLLEKHTSTIPSSTINLPDISLYDHLKTTAAFAVALLDYAKVNKIDTIADLKNAENPFLLLGADVSGIQSYIYDIISSNAAKNLKGRSFYLQLLTESVIQRILKELDLFQTNVIYNSGGGFYILAPNTHEIIEKFISTSKDIVNQIFKEHKTSLYIAFDYELLSKKSIFEHNINICWKSLSDKLNNSKRQRYKNQLIENYNLFFEPSGGKDYGRDAITGEEFEESSNKQVKKDGLLLNETTIRQIDLGKRLKHAQYWITSNESIPYLKEAEFQPCKLGVFHYFLGVNELAEQKQLLKGSIDNVQIKKINALSFDPAIAGSNNSVGYVFYGGNDFPVEEDGFTPKTFNMLGGDGGFKRIAVLRMDVDNLGKAFISGFADGSKTFSRYSALSRNLDFFFKGYINEIWRDESFRNHSMIIYSGGDDLFIVGKWNIIFDIAERIYKDFREWSCYNPYLTLSGGISIIDEKYPIMKGAEEAGKAEDQAKKYQFGVNEKHAISIFNTAISWQFDLPMIVAYKNTIKQLLSMEKGLPKAFVSKIFAYHENATFSDGKLRPLSIQWMMAYDFGRMEKRLSNQEAKNLLDEIKINVFANTYNNLPLKEKSNHHFLQLLNIAVRWAELELRTQYNS